MKKRIAITSLLALALIAAIGFGYAPSMETTASCAECSSEGSSIAKDIFKKFAEECGKVVPEGESQPKKCLVLNAYNKVLPILKVLARDNRFGPGDRILFVGEAQNGFLVGGINRAFQSGAPSDKDSLTVEVTKKDGGNGAIIRICSIDEAGTLTHLKSFRFEEDSTTGTKSETVSGVTGKTLRVEVNSFGGVAKKFQYTLKTRQ